MQTIVGNTCNNYMNIQVIIIIEIILTRKSYKEIVLAADFRH